MVHIAYAGGFVKQHVILMIAFFLISLLELFDWTKRLLVKLLKHYIGWPSVVIAYEENGFLLNPKSFFIAFLNFL